MNVLLAIDESSCSEAAVDAVITHYRPSDTNVCVAHVVAWPQERPTAWAFAQGPSAAQSVLRKRRELHRRGRALLARATVKLRRAGFKATPKLLEGSARQVIVTMADQWPADTTSARMDARGFPGCCAAVCPLASSVTRPVSSMSFGNVGTRPRLTPHTDSRSSIHREALVDGPRRQARSGTEEASCLTCV